MCIVSRIELRLCVRVFVCERERKREGEREKCLSSTERSNFVKTPRVNEKDIAEILQIISLTNMLMTNEMHNSYNQFYSTDFFVCSTCFEQI